MNNRRNNYHRHFGIFSIVELAIKSSFFAISIAFKMIAVFFQIFGNVLHGSNASKQQRKPCCDAKDSQSQHTANQGPYSTAGTAQKSEFSTASRQPNSMKPSDHIKGNGSQPKASSKPGSTHKNEESGNEKNSGDWNIIIFVLTLVPSIIALAAGEILYAAGIAAAGICLMIVYSTIRGIFIKAKKAAKEKQAARAKAETEDDVLEKVIKDAFDKIYAIRRDLHKVDKPEIRAKVENLCVMSETIIGEVRTNPESMSTVKKFFYYYLDAFCEIFKKYMRISTFTDSSEDIEKFVMETEKSFADIEKIFKGLCEKMVEKDMLDLKAEINVIKNSN